MKEMHPTQKIAIKITKMLMDEGVKPNIGMAALATCLIVTAKQAGYSKAEILNKVGNNIDTIDADMGGRNGNQ
jgi:hypothetical protein